LHPHGLSRPRTFSNAITPEIHQELNRLIGNPAKIGRGRPSETRVVLDKSEKLCLLNTVCVMEIRARAVRAVTAAIRARA
jgi:hypothetical protein